jgi:hypothetical protein
LVGRTPFCQSRFLFQGELSFLPGFGQFRHGQQGFFGKIDFRLTIESKVSRDKTGGIL